jgi:hypothetical protein
MGLAILFKSLEIVVYPFATEFLKIATNAQAFIHKSIDTNVISSHSSHLSHSSNILLASLVSMHAMDSDDDVPAPCFCCLGKA